MTSAPGRRAAISRYSALAGSTTSHGVPCPAAASSRDRTVCDLPAPVAPQTNTCRLSESRGRTNEQGRRFRSRISPSAMPGCPPGAAPSGGHPAGRSWVSRSQGGAPVAPPAPRTPAAGPARPGTGSTRRTARPARRHRQARGRTGAGARAGADGRRAQRVRQPAQIGRRAQQPGDPGRARPVPPARPDRDPPEPGRLAALQLGLPFLEPSRLGGAFREPVGRPLGDPLPQPDLLRQRSQLGRGHRLGRHQPAERPGPAAEQPLIDRQPGLAGRARRPGTTGARVLARQREQAVAIPAISASRPAARAPRRARPAAATARAPRRAAPAAPRRRPGRRCRPARPRPR